MTGPGSDDEQDSLVIHWDGGDGPGRAPEAAGQQPPKLPLHQRYRYQLVALLILAAVCLAAYGYGAATYDPPSRLPALAFDTADPLFGTNATVAAELRVVLDNFADPQALELQAEGPVFRVNLPRSVADRLYGKRDESLTIFSARSPAGESRFLVATEAGEPAVLAVEAPLGLSRRDQPTGVFLALDPANPAFAPITQAIEGLIPEAGHLSATVVSPTDLYVFGPIQENGDALRTRIETNLVMSYLTGEIADSNGDVSLETPAFLLLPRPARGTINALYHPERRLIMEPLWGSSATASLAHELTHAYLDTVVADKSDLLTQASDYFGRSHPVLHGKVVGDLYERLDDRGRAEETLAFLVGAIAAQQTKTVSTQQLLENQGNLAISEAILYSDVRLLIGDGLLPACMQPDEGATGAITFAFYQRVQSACQ